MELITLKSETKVLHAFGVDPDAGEESSHTGEVLALQERIIILSCSGEGWVTTSLWSSSRNGREEEWAFLALKGKSCDRVRTSQASRGVDGYLTPGGAKAKYPSTCDLLGCRAKKACRHHCS
ncbi:hypothetical protein ACLOJK_008506 [Asimina triloba]